MITYSSISTLEECPYSFYLEYIEKIKSVKPKTFLGSAVHTLNEKAIKKIDVKFPNEVQKAINKNPILLLQATAISKAVIDSVDLSNYSSEMIIERKYRGVMFGGKLDLTETDANGEIIGIADFKVTAMGSLTFLSSMQLPFYAWLMNKPVSMKYIVIPAPTIRLKASETEEQYFDRLYEKTKGNITILEKRFSRSLQHRVINWVDGVISNLSHFKTFGFPKQYTACSGYKFGNCSSLPICSSDNPHTLIDNEFFHYGITHEELGLDEDIIADIPVEKDLIKKGPELSINNCRSLITSGSMEFLDDKDKIIAILVSMGYTEKVLSKIFKRVTKNMLKKFLTYKETIEELLIQKPIKSGSNMDIELSSKALSIIKE